MIKKSLITAFSLIILWSIIVNLMDFSIHQHQWQKNIITAEKIIFDTIRMENIIVGSSLSRRIIMDSLPGSFHNVAMAGQSVFDGLNIIKSKKKLPKSVYIETNFISRAKNQVFKNIVTSPSHNFLKEKFIIFRSDKQPLAAIGNTLISTTNSIFLKTSHPTRNQGLNEVPPKVQLNDSFFNKMLAMQKERYTDIIDTSFYNKQFKILKNQVNYFSKHNVNIVFFEMPVHPSLVNLNMAIYVRERLRHDFPEIEFIKLPTNYEHYRTSDGLHLTEEESSLYTSYFKEELSDLKKI